MISGIKEKTMYHYQGDSPETSYQFWLARVNPKSAEIVVDRGTPEVQIFSVSTDNLKKMFSQDRVMEIDTDVDTNARIQDENQSW